VCGDVFFFYLAWDLGDSAGMAVPSPRCARKLFFHLEGVFSRPSLCCFPLEFFVLSLLLKVRLCWL